MEILQRRNSRKKKCLKDVYAYDSIVVDEYVKNKGCRAPYLRTDVTVPLCNSNKTMKDGLINYMKASSATVPKPCYRVSTLKTKGEYKNMLGFENSKVWYLTIQYPSEVKVITQSKEVDIHTLIGNIGGYLGLFLGKLFNTYSIRFVLDFFIGLHKIVLFTFHLLFICFQATLLHKFLISCLLSSTL